MQYAKVKLKGKKIKENLVNDNQPPSPPSTSYLIKTI